MTTPYYDTPRPWDAKARRLQSRALLPPVHTRCGDCGASILMVVGSNVTTDSRGRIVARCLDCREKWGSHERTT